ncbi:hypothetical protein V1517DRAFT_270113 [Lipomyces orientalis]|uniref:Uncharacterized protein n=1 Tax=Lipomyces orientalis TaxID=1233043 RepID=A0ACC3TWV5_9ASCO
MSMNLLPFRPARRSSAFVRQNWALYFRILRASRRGCRSLTTNQPPLQERRNVRSQPTKQLFAGPGPLYQKHGGHRVISTISANSPFWTRRRLALVGVLAIAGMVYVMFPKHNYPKEVADLIRLGLKAERKDTPDNYERAISFYLSALEVAEHLDMSQTCDEYTGLQIKVGEILERLDAYESALLMYNNILDNGIVWLQEDPRRAGTMSFDKLVRYLRVSVRAAEVAETIEQTSANLPMLGMWIETLQKRLPDNYSKLLPTHVMDIEQDRPIPLESYDFPQSPTTEEKRQFKHVDHDIEDTLSLARDYYATLLIQNSRPGIGYQLKNENIKLMQIMDNPLPRILRTQVDIASAYFICYERATADESQIANQPDAPRYLQLAEACLKDALSRMTEIRASSDEPLRYSEEDHQDLDIAQALAIYGLGVIEAKKTNYRAAMDLLKEARIRAMGSQYPELVDKIKEEWSIIMEHLNKDRVMDTDAIADAMEYLGPLTEAASDK